MNRIVLVALGVSAFLGIAQPASALPAFYQEFEKKYISPSKHVDFKEAAAKARCNLCHLKGKSKRRINDYGKELARLIEGSARQRLADTADDARDAEKQKLMEELGKAFKEVAKKNSPDGSTFGARLSEGQLPVVVN